MEPFSITLPGMVLSPPTAADVDQIFTLCQDDEIQRWTTVPSPYERSHAEDFCLRSTPQDWQMGLNLTWAIRDHRGDVLGMIALLSRSEGNWEVGYWLGAAHRGQGHLVKALNAVIDCAFNPTGPIHARRMLWRCSFDGNVPNWASWRAAWRVGFHKQGRERSAEPGRPNVGTQSTGASQSTHTITPRRDHWLADLLPDDPRRPAAPWDGPVPHSPLSAFEQEACPTDSHTLREGDCPEGLVARFQRLYERPIATDGPHLHRDSVGLRMRLISEEFGELFEAVYGTTARSVVDEATRRAMDNDEENRDVVGAADALADLIYVIYGMALEMGIDLPAVLAEVQRSNMSKMGPDGHPILRADGKVLKGPGYFPPDVSAVLKRSQEF